MAVPANFAQELGALDFERLIGGPLVAAVNAHNMAQLATVDFIQRVGFVNENSSSGANPDPDGAVASKVRMIYFEYQRDVVDENGNTAKQTVTFSVPFLLLVRIPYFEVDSVDITFNVELTSVETASTSSAFNFKGEARFKHGWAAGHVKLKASASYSRTTKTGARVERRYTYQVKVHAGAEEPPEGVTKLLDALISLIKEEDSSGQSQGSSNPGAGGSN